MASFNGGGDNSGFDYVQGATPSGAEEGEEWYADGSGTKSQGAYVYDGASWIEQTVTDHSQLSGVSASDHHAQTTAGTGLSFDSTNAVINALLGNALGTDANGNIVVQEGNISYNNISDTHSRPSGTKSAGLTGGELREINASGVQNATSDTIRAVSDRVRWDIYNSSSSSQTVTVTVYFADGTSHSQSNTVGTGNSWTGSSTYSAKVVDYVEYSAQYNSDPQVWLRYDIVADHSHNI